MAETHLIDVTGRTVFRGTQKPPGGGSQPYVPTAVPGLACWYDASQLALTDADPVALWPDLSGNGNDAAQAGATSQPTFKAAVLNGLGIVRFDNSLDNQYLDLANLALFNGLAAFTVAAVVVPNFDGHSDQSIFTATTDSRQAKRAGLYCESSADFTIGISDEDTVDVPLNLGASNTNPLFAGEPFALVGAASLGPVGIALHDGAGRLSSMVAVDAATGPSIPNSDADAIQIGADNTIGTGPAQFWGDLAELLVWTRGLDSAERRQTLEYLSAKWGTL